MFGKRAPKLERRQVMQAVPLRNPQVEVEYSESGQTVLSIPLRTDWLGKLLGAYHRFIFLGKKQQAHKVELDELGSQVYELIDGERTVDDLVKTLAAAHKLSRREVEVSLTEYLKTLGKRGIIAFAVPREQSQSETDEQETSSET